LIFKEANQLLRLVSFTLAERKHRTFNTKLPVSLVDIEKAYKTI